MLTAASDWLRCSLKHTHALMRITTDPKKSNIHFAIQNRRKHVNEHAKQCTEQPMQCFENKTATLYMQEETLRAGNIKETLTQANALILSCAHTHISTAVPTWKSLSYLSWLWSLSTSWGSVATLRTVNSFVSRACAGWDASVVLLTDGSAAVPLVSTAWESMWPWHKD